MMHKRYYTMLLVAALALIGTSPALAQFTESFSSDSLGTTAFTGVANSEWAGGTVENVGIATDPAYLVDPSSTAQVTFPDAEISGITMIWANAAAAVPSTATAYSDLTCTTSVGTVSSSNSIGAKSLSGTGVRCVEFATGANAAVVDEFTFTATVLAVEMASFTAAADDQGVSLNWQTSSETNNYGFEVQRRVNGTFEKVGFVEGAGTTSKARTYGYRVAEVAPGMQAFRLKQIDTDGTFSYSSIVEVDVTLPGQVHLSAAYPNPFNPQTQFSLTIAREQNVRVAVYDMLGREVALLNDGVLAGEQAHQFTFDAQNLSSGIYLIRAVGEQFSTTRQVTLLK